MTLRIDYPELSAAEGFAIHDDVEVDMLDDGRAELRTHARNMPLAPGDVVTHDGEAVTGVEQYAPVWTIEVEFKLPANLTFMKTLPPHDPSNIKIEETVTGWQRDAWVTKHSGYTYLVSAPDREWLTDRVQGSPFVDHMELVRFPDMEIDFDTARRHASLETLTEGPWA